MGSERTIAVDGTWLNTLGGMGVGEEYEKDRRRKREGAVKVMGYGVWSFRS